MARFCVLQPGDNSQDHRAHNHIARTNAEGLIRYGWARRESDRAIRMLHISEPRPDLIPERMPPVEIGGCKFVPPATANLHPNVPHLEHNNWKALQVSE